MIRTARLVPALIALGLSFPAGPAHAAPHAVHDGQLHLSLPAAPLAELGLEVSSVRAQGAGHAWSIPLAPSAPEAALEPADGTLSHPLRALGGLAFRTWNPADGRATAPAFLFEATVHLDGTELALVGADPSIGTLLTADAGGAWDEIDGAYRLDSRPLRVATDWAKALGRPDLAGAEVGTVELRLSAGPRHSPAPALDADRPLGSTLDVIMNELYFLESRGRTGIFPNGLNGLSASTTSCNLGDVDVDWYGPMSEDHPFIGLAMFREMNGRLEQIGRNWIKHGFFSVNDDRCIGCTNGAGANILYVGCSDTYSSGNNGDYFYLGPREEVNPHTAEWSACGSFFDEPTSPDPDCSRNYFGGGGTNDRRLGVTDADLNHPTATYYYEGLYVVKDDDDISNNVGWRRLASLGWDGNKWQFGTFNEDPFEPRAANVGALVMTWGDVQSQVPVASDDGLAMLAVEVTDLLDGYWRYEYAFYNRTSARALHSFSVPLPTGVSTRNLTFRDLDTDAGNDWTTTTTGGAVTWATDDYATDPNANVLEYQSLFNLGFEADQPPATVGVTGGIFRPGLGTSFVLNSLGPDAPTGGPVVIPGDEAPGLRLAGRNPSAGDLRLVVTVAEPSPVRLVVRDVRGRLVQTLLDGAVPAGSHQVAWDGRDAGGSRAAAGVYFFRLETPAGVHTTKGTLLR